MKKNLIAIICSLFVLCFSLSCDHLNNHNTSMQVSESEHYFKLLAHFNKNRTRNVEIYMDKKIGTVSNMSFVNSQIDGKIALDDHTTFYIKKYPGYLEIKLDKGENSPGSYKEIKDMAEGLKSVIQ
jgi:hypothetical protein